jgi:hypothetical protein
MQSLPPSTTMPEFSDSPMLQRISSRSSPNILSAEYDPFAPFQSDMGSSYATTLFNKRSTDISLPPASPSLSAVASHRSSFSSAQASETYSHPESYPILQPRVKMENRLEWSSDGSTCLVISAPQTDSSTLATSSSSYPISLGNSFFHDNSGAAWSKDETTDALNSHTSSRPTLLAETIRFQETEPKGPFGNIARTRTPRKMTTREEANYQCKAKGCGKLFSRSYNFKAHMETHDSSRIYPFPCPLPDCNKKFVRKTDLQRHHQSVHMKERNFRCEFCSRYFARKDTLRRFVKTLIVTVVKVNRYRHMEDGCSKRFDLAVGYNQYHSTSQEELKNVPQPASVQPPFSSTSSAYPSIPIRPSSNLPGIYLRRADFRDSENVQGPPWSN